MQLFGYELTLRRKSIPLVPMVQSPDRIWYSTVREPSTGAWQRNEELQVPGALTNPTVFTCTTMIAADVAKMRLRLVTKDPDGIWTETTNPAYSPVLRRPNRYQIAPAFVEQWILSKLCTGNTFVLKERDSRGVVRALYVLDPARVIPLVAPDGAVYYQLRRDDLAGVPDDATFTAAPASEIIHDRMNCFFHPLIGNSPIYAAGLAALQAGRIQVNSTQFFSNGSKPSGTIYVPGAITKETAARVKNDWETGYSGSNYGKVAVLGDGMKYEAQTVHASDAQLIEQLNWTAETIAACYHVPIEMIIAREGVHQWTPEQLTQLYYTECLQKLVTDFEGWLDDGLELAADLGTELDIDDLIWMDTSTRTKAAETAIGAGALAPNEARSKYFGMGKVEGGDTPYMQQQNFSLAALNQRDQDDPFSKAAPAPPAVPATGPGDAALEAAAFRRALLKQTEDLYGR